MSAAECCLALERLDAELAEELGAGYQSCDRFRELLANCGDAPTDRERTLVASYHALNHAANEILRRYDARQQ